MSLCWVCVLYLSLFVCLSPSIFLTLCHSLSAPLFCLSASLSVSLCLSGSLSHILFLSFTGVKNVVWPARQAPDWLSVCLSVCPSLSVSLFLFLYLLSLLKVLNAAWSLLWCCVSFWSSHLWNICCTVNIVTSAGSNLLIQNRAGVNPSLTGRIIDNPQIYEF